MANGIADLGNNLGWIYTVNSAGTAIAGASERNTPQGARNAKLLAAQSVALSLNKRAYGTITISAVAGSGDVTAVTIDGVNQISANVSYSAGPTADVATAIAAAINSFTPGSGYDYIAVAISNVVYVYAPIEAGSAPNGEAITVSNTGNLTTVQADFNYGSDNTSVFDTATGYRFYLDANYGATPAEPGEFDPATAIEITNYIIPRGLNTAFDNQSKTIASGVITITRESAVTVVDVDTQAAAASDDLDSITFGDGSDGDIVILRGANSSRLVTVTSSGNINRTNSFVTADKDTQICLMYLSGEFWEFARSGGNYVPTAAAFRTALFPFLATAAQGRTTLTPADNTTVTLTANSSKMYERVSGSVSLSAGNYTISLSTTGVVDGDEFVIDYYGTITVGGQAVIIGGVTLSTAEALYGGVRLHFVVNSGAWAIVGRSYDINTYPIQTANIGTGQVTTVKLATELQYEVMTIPVSFEANEVGDIKVLMPYACSVTNTYSSVSKTVAATDDGTIVFKNNAGTTMTGATITVAASSAVGTADTGLATANNTFTAGEVMTLTTAKATAGGRCVVSVQLVRA